MLTTPSTERRTRRAGVLLVTLALFLAPLIGVPCTGPVAYAADNGTWAVYPTPATGANAAATPYFILDASPGTTLTEHATIANAGGHPMTFKVYGADAYNTPRDGGFALRGLGDKQTDIGAWTKTDTATLTVSAHQSADVRFTLTIPANAVPGDHAGALVALDATTEGTQQQGGVTVGIQRAVGARVYLHVIGNAQPALAVEDVHLDHRAPLLPYTGSSAATLHYTLVNRGNTILQPRIALTATDLLGRTTLHTQPRNLALTLLPGQRVQLTEPWPHAPQFGRDRLTVHITTPDAGPQTTATATLTTIPWLALTLLLVLSGAVIALARIRRRNRNTARTTAPSRGRHGNHAPTSPLSPGPAAQADDM